jgi:Ca-activated chloride channel family protein
MDEERVTQGTLRTPAGLVLPLERTEVEAKVTGPVARVRVRQAFRNTTGDPIEAVYLFPLPHEASVFAMQMRIGGRTVRGVVKEKEEAKRAYERARSEGRAATLLEQDRPNLFTLSAANVPAGETIEVTLEYQERLAYDDGEWRFVFPMVAPERYAPGAPARGGSAGTAEVPDLGRVRPPSVPTGERSADVSVAVEIASGHGGEPRSPSHRLEVAAAGPGAWRARLHPSETLPNRDFVLAWRDERRGVRADAHFERRAGRPGTFLLVVRPPAVDAEALAPGLRAPRGEGQALTCGNCGGAMRDAGALVTLPEVGPAWRCAYCGVMVAASAERMTDRGRLPRDVVFVVDRSRSMRGGSLAQARRAVARVLEGLEPVDAVQAIAFDHERVAFDGSGGDWVGVSPEASKGVLAFLEGLRPRGGTELEQALERAMALPTRPARSRVVVLLTDAALGNEGRLLRRVGALVAPPRARLYVLGVGPAVNRYLVDKLARVGGGASDVLLPGEDVEVVAGRFARRVAQAGPVLRRLALAWDDAMPADVYPSPVPDLFGGQPVQLLGRYAGEGPSRLVLTGETADGAPFRQEIDVRLPAESDDVPGLERLWARARIEARLDRLVHAPEEASDVRAEVLGLALRHGLMSPYTALVAEDSEVVGAPERAPRRVDVSQAPAGGAVLGDDDETPAVGIAAYGAALFETSGEEEDAAPTTLTWAAETRSGAAPRGGARPSAESFGPGHEGARGPAPWGGPPAAAAPPGRAAFAPASRSAPGGAPAAGSRPTGAPAGLAPPPPPAAPPPPGFAPPSPAAFAPPPPPPAFAPPPVAGAGAPGGPPMPRPPAPPPPGGPMPSPMAPPAARPAPKGAGLLGRVASIVDAVVGGERGAPSPAVPGQQQPPQRPPVGVRPEGEPYPAEVIAWARGRGVGDLDLVFLVDETGSMGSYIAQVKLRLLELVDAVRASPLARSLRLGLVTFRDHPPQDASFVSRAVPLTDDVAAIRKAVESMQASGGGDGPEALTDGLVDLVRLDWRPSAALLVGDAPPHGVEPGGDGFPEGCPCGHHWYTQAENCREMGVVVHALGCLPALRAYVGAEDVFRTIAKTTRGMYLPLDESHRLVPLVAAVAEAELDRQRIAEHVADVVTAYGALLAPTDDGERVRFVTDVLREANVRPRALAAPVGDVARPSLRFRELEPADVEAALEQLRRAERVSV